MRISESVAEEGGTDGEMNIASFGNGDLSSNEYGLCRGQIIWVCDPSK
jgi:hypothetical protein